MEVLKGVILVFLRLEWLGSNLLVTTTVTALNGAQAAPLGTIDREVSGMTQCRAEQVSADTVTSVELMAIGTGHV
jgi:hypothetical protein